MKYIVLTVLTLLAVPVMAYDVWQSSTTATADTTKNLCTDRRGILHEVVVSSAGATGASASVFASSATTGSPVAVVDATRVGVYPYDLVTISTQANHSGLTYSTVGTAQVQIIYQCY